MTKFAFFLSDGNTIVLDINATMREIHEAMLSGEVILGQQNEREVIVNSKYIIRVHNHNTGFLGER